MPESLRREVRAGRIEGTDIDLVFSAVEFLRTHRDQRFFLYVHMMDVHQYVSDAETAAGPGWDGEGRAEGWVRGSGIGDAGTGRVTAFIPSEAEFVAADRAGNVYGAHVPGETLVKYAAPSQRP